SPSPRTHCRTSISDRSIVRAFTSCQGDARQPLLEDQRPRIGTNRPRLARRAWYARVMPSAPDRAALLVVTACAALACGHPGGGDPAQGDASGTCGPLPAIGTGDAVGRADALIPKPRSLTIGAGQLALTSRSAIVARAEAARAAAQVLAE